MSKYDKYRIRSIEYPLQEFCKVIEDDARLTGVGESRCLYPNSSCVECPIGQIPTTVSLLRGANLIDGNDVRGVTRVLIGRTTEGAKLQNRIGNSFYPLPRPAY